MSGEQEQEQEHEHENEYETRVWLVRTMAVGLAAAIAVAFAFVIGVLPLGGGSDGTDDGELALTSDAAASSDVDASSDSDVSTDSDSDLASSVNEPAASSIATLAATDRFELSDEDADTSGVNIDTSSDGAESDSDGASSDADTGVSDSDAPTPAETSTSPATTIGASAGQPSYPVLPDGSPVPVLGIYDGELITLSGVVPSEEAADRLRTLALAFSKVPDADVANLMTVDPTIPINVGVRVIEMSSIRFPEGTPRISPEHALELDRVALLMTALPQVTTVVIGHADQRGDSERNFALSADRARAALDYIAAQGIDPTRLSARGAGESDLLTLNDDDAALALNRRTEFVISGLFVDPPAVTDPAPTADSAADEEPTE